MYINYEAFWTGDQSTEQPAEATEQTPDGTIGFKMQVLVANEREDVRHSMKFVRIMMKERTSGYHRR